ncbi:hypothetical protein BDV11DRAFT_95512 [Aspergillus similis]
MRNGECTRNGRCPGTTGGTSPGERCVPAWFTVHMFLSLASGIGSARVHRIRLAGASRFSSQASKGCRRQRQDRFEEARTAASGAYCFAGSPRAITVRLARPLQMQMGGSSCSSCSSRLGRASRSSRSSRSSRLPGSKGAGERGSLSYSGRSGRQSRGR